MWNDPAQEMNRLRDEYARKYDGELEALREDEDQLTETARQVLHEELKKRGLGETEAAPKESLATVASVHEVADERWDVLGPQTPKLEDDDAADGAEEREYTWKTYLCECETRAQAMQLGEALRRAGIESWVVATHGQYRKVMVPADQLKQAQAVAAQPIPLDIVNAVTEGLEAPPEYFTMPACPACGTEDPVLLASEPVNRWQCEACGREWEDAPAQG